MLFVSYTHAHLLFEVPSLRFWAPRPHQKGFLFLIFTLWLREHVYFISAMSVIQSRPWLDDSWSCMPFLFSWFYIISDDDNYSCTSFKSVVSCVNHVILQTSGPVLYIHVYEEWITFKADSPKFLFAKELISLVLVPHAQVISRL